jgi:hypothetical protein
VLYLSSLHRVFFIVDGWGWVVGGTGVWTQGLHLEPLHQPFFVIVFSR